MKAKYSAFALIEVVIVIVLISGSFLVFLEALNQANPCTGIQCHPAKRMGAGHATCCESEGTL